MATSWGKSIKYGWLKDKTTSKLVKFTQELLHLTKTVWSSTLFTPTFQYFYTDISAISVTFCNSAWILVLFTHENSRDQWKLILHLVVNCGCAQKNPELQFLVLVRPACPLAQNRLSAIDWLQHYHTSHHSHRHHQTQNHQYPHSPSFNIFVIVLPPYKTNAIQGN